MYIQHLERHRTDRIGWLRAAVLGANDGIVSTASLVVGVAAANSQANDVLVAGVAGLVAGAMSMAAGEYVSVSSQSDTEKADLDRERNELATNSEFELDELTAVYVGRGVESTLARQVASQMMAHDALGIHARDELGISDLSTARPIQAAFASAGTFAVGGGLAVGLGVAGPVCDAHSDCHYNIDLVSGTVGGIWRPCGRCSCRQGGCASNVLGCPGNGSDSGSRRSVWSSRVTGLSSQQVN